MRPSIPLLLTAALAPWVAHAAGPQFPAFVPLPGDDLVIDRDRQQVPTGTQFDFDPAAALDDQGCPRLITPQLCVDPNFLDSECGIRELFSEDSFCHAPFAAHMSAWAAQAPQVEVVDPNTGEIVTVSLEDAPDDIAWQGFQGSYGGDYLGDIYPMSTADQVARADQLQWWDQNCSVQSCEEYAFESVQDYAQYETRIAPYLAVNDWRGVFDETYGANGIAHRTLYNSDGEQLADLPLDLPRSHTIPGLPRHRRNAFVGWSPGEALVVPQIQGFADNDRPWNPVMLTIFALSLTGELPTAATLGGHQDQVAGDALDDVVTYCTLDELDGLMHCRNGASLASRQIATRFNAHLVGFDPATTVLLDDPTPVTWPPTDVDPWTFHETTSQALTNIVPDEKLLWLERRQEQFLKAAKARNAAWDDISLAVSRSIGWDGCVHFQDNTTCLDPVNPVDRLMNAFETMREADLTLRGLLAVGEQSGCFGPAPTPCDWSPRWTALAVTGHLQRHRDRLYNACVRRTGNDFRLLRDDTPGDGDPHWLVAQEQFRTSQGLPGICASIPEDRMQELSECAVLDDYMRSPRTVRAYFDTLDAWIETLDLQTDPETGRPTLGDSSSDTNQLGNTDFGANLDFGAGWSLNGLDAGVCNVGVEAWGRLRAGAKVFGVHVPPQLADELPDGVVHPDDVASARATANLFFADLYGKAAPVNGGSGGHAIIDLLGVNLYAAASGPSQSDGAGYRYHFASAVSDQDQIDLLDGSKTFFIGPVPVNLRAGVAGGAAISSDVNFEAEACRHGTSVLEAHGNMRFRPSLDAFGFADVSAGLSGLAAIGVDANLTLIEAALPFTFQADAVLDTLGERPDAKPEASLNILADLDLELTMLRGQMRLYVEFLFERFSRTVLRVSGIEQTYPLFHESWPVNLEALMTAVASLGGSDSSLPNDGQPASARPILVVDLGTCTTGSRPDADVYFGFNDADLLASTFEATLGNADLTVGSAQPGFQGVHGQAIDTTNGGLDATPGSVFPIGNQRAWSVWVRPQANSTGVIAAHGTAGQANTGLTLRRTSNGQAQLLLHCDGGRVVSATGGVLPLHTWSHVGVLAFPGDDGHMLFVDGQEVGRTSTCLPSYSGFDVHVGQTRTPSGASSFFPGQIDELAYWGSDRLLTSDMEQLYAQGLAGRPLSGAGSAPLSGVSSLTGSLVANTLDLSWTNPPSIGQANHGYDHVVVRVGTDAYPTTVTAGIAGYSGTASAASIPVSGADDIWRVASFAVDANGSIRPGPRIEVRRPLASLPDVTQLTAMPGSDHVRLSWNVPSDPRVQQVIVRRAANAPPSSPERGVAVYAGLGDTITDVGLPADTTWHYAVWSRDGYGRLSAGLTISASTATGIVPDTTPPDALANVAVEVVADRVWLGWDKPLDADPVRVQVWLKLKGFSATRLYEGDDTEFTHAPTIPGLLHTYTLVPVDEAGNKGPATTLLVTPRHIAPVVDIVATPSTDQVEVKVGLYAPAPFATHIVRATIPASTPHIGVPICTLTTGVDICADTTAQPGITYVYTAFARDEEGYYSAPLSSDGVQLLAPATVSLVAPTTGLGGEIVTLRATAGGTISAPSWTQTSGPTVRLVHVDETQAWFRVPETTGTVEMTFTGTFNGQSDSQTTSIDIAPYSGPRASLPVNPFLGDLLAAQDNVSFAVHGTDIVAVGTEGFTQRLSKMTADGTVLSSHTGSWAPVRGLNDDLILTATDDNHHKLYLRGTDAPIYLDEVHAGYSDRWVGDWKGERLAVRTSYAGDQTIKLFSADTSGLSLEGVLTLDSGPYTYDVALSANAKSLYLATSTGIDIVDLTAIAALGVQVFGEPVAIYASELIPSGNVRFVRTYGDRMVVGHGGTWDGPSELSLFDISDTLHPVWLDSVADAPSGADKAQVVGAYLTVTNYTSTHVYDLAADTFARVPGQFASGVTAIGDAIVAPSQPDPQVWVSGSLFTPSTANGVVRYALDGGLDPLDTTVVPTGGAFSTGARLDSHEGVMVVAGFSELIHGTADGIVTTFLPNPGELMCMTDDSIVMLEGAFGALTVTQRDRITGVEISSWSGVHDCGVYTCAGDVVTNVCGEDLRVYDRGSGLLLGTRTVPDLPESPVIVGEPGPAGALFGDELRMVDPTSGVLNAGLGDHDLLLDYTGYASPWLWRGALFTDSSFGITRYWLGNGSTGLSPTPVLPDLTSDYAIDAASGQIAVWRSRSFDTFWLDETTDDLTPAASLPSLGGFGFTIDGGIAFTSEGTDIVEHRPVAAHTEPMIGAPTTSQTVSVPFTFAGPARSTASVHCEVTGGSCVATRTGVGTGTVSWTLPASPGPQELLVVVGDPRWLVTARERIIVEGAP